MVPQTQKRKPRNSSKVNLIISLVFHSAIAILVIYFAAREGLLGKQFKKIAVEIVKEKPVEKPKEPEKPKEQIPVPAPKIVQAEPPRQTVSAPPPVNNSDGPPVVAPAAVDVPSFSFAGGKTVETSSDPVQLYKGLLQFTLQSRWDRPEDMNDGAFVAEVEISVDHSGRLSNPVWKKGSGNTRWDNTVRQAIAATPSMDRTPPTNFPSRVLVRFDVAETDAVQFQP